MGDMEWKELLNHNRLRESLGGRASDEQKNEKRDQIERDRGRAVFSTPIRRLQDKAQVFPLEPNDSVRTRLTHSLEVSSVARGLARQVSKEVFDLDDEVERELARQLETIAETCGLIHDVGNPPFGHAGEDAIQYWFRSKAVNSDNSLTSLGRTLASHDLGDWVQTADDVDDSQLFQDFAKYEGNAQTLRTMCRLQLMADPYGLNFTLATLSAAQKYTAPSHKVTKERQSRSKPGFFATEADVVKLVRKRTGTEERRNPIAYMVEAADDAVYAAVDLEDAARKGETNWRQIREAIRKRCENGSAFVEDIEQKIDERSANANFPNELTEAEREEAYCQLFRTYVIVRLTNAAAEEFIEKYDEIMAGEYDSELLETGGEKDLWDTCKSFAKEEVFCSRGILELESMGRRVITDLLDFFWEGAQCFNEEAGDVPFGDFPFENKAFHLMSANHRRVFRFQNDAGSLPKEYYALQLVTDYVCGMTDSFAKNLHRKLVNSPVQAV